MPNPFDNLKKRVFDTTTRVMGYDAEWTPSNNPLRTDKARVHLYKPSESDKRLQHMEYSPREYYMEYFITDFDGLFKLSSYGSEEVVIEGITYIVEEAVGIFDGDTCKVRLHKPDEL